jgi:LysR family glycine cleavage system transcriptional activator
VRHGDGQWPGLSVTRLCVEEIFPVCSPELLRGRGALRSPADLARHTLLHVNDRRDWGKWLDAAGMATSPSERGPIFNQISMSIDAAVDGQGIALARSALAAWDMRAGRLVRPFPFALKAPYGYWIVCPKSTADLPKIVTFREWLLAEAAEDTRQVKTRLKPRTSR